MLCLSSLVVSIHYTEEMKTGMKMMDCRMQEKLFFRMTEDVAPTAASIKPGWDHNNHFLQCGTKIPVILKEEFTSAHSHTTVFNTSAICCSEQSIVGYLCRWREQ